MRRFSIASAVFLSVLSVGSAFAADLPVKAPVALPVFSWSGAYIGVNLGYGWGRETVTGTVTGTQTSAGVVTTLAPAALFGGGSLNGGFGGGQIGYNWQFANWMVGLEGNADGTAQRRTFDVCTISGCPLGSTVVSTNYRLVWFGTDRVRIGYLPTDRLFLYGTGGLAIGSFRAESGPPIANGPLFDTWSNLKAGWTAGAGLEVAMDYNWSFKLEYLFMDFGNVGGPNASSTTIAGGVTTVKNFSFSTNFTDNLVQIGFNYRFLPGPGAAVVANY